MIPVNYSTQLNPTSRNRGSRLIKAGFWSSRLIGITLLALLALLYIAQNSQGATKQINYEQSKTDAESLQQDNKDLMININRLKALATIDQSTQDLKLQPVQSIEFLSPNPSIAPSASSSPKSP